MSTVSANPPERPSSVFVTTSWHDIRLFSQEGSDALAARERFCRKYWRPLYVYLRVFLRRRGADQGAAEDLVQAFFEYLLERPRLPVQPRGDGRFRSFLICALENFLKDRRKSDGRQKRRPSGGLVSLESEGFGERFDAEYSCYDSPERALCRAFALELLSNALASAREEVLATGQTLLWAAVEPLLEGADDDVPYAVRAQRLGMTEGAFKIAVHRCRKRFRQCLRVEVARTLGWEGLGARDLDSALAHDDNLRCELADEMAHLLDALT